MFDAGLKLVLGLFLLLYPWNLVEALGMPAAALSFYPRVLGGVLIGIGIALWIDIAQRLPGMGLGLGGAIGINLCGGLTLGGWLLGSEMNLPDRGQVLLWTLLVVVVGLSTVELVRIIRTGEWKWGLTQVGHWLPRPTALHGKAAERSGPEDVWEGFVQEELALLRSWHAAELAALKGMRRLLFVRQLRSIAEDRAIERIPPEVLA